MGGNSVGSTRGRKTSTSTPREKKLDRVMRELRDLKPSSRQSAIRSLEKSGFAKLAEALKALLPGSGSRPTERSGGGAKDPGKNG